MPTSTGKGGGKEGEEERDGGSEGWFDCGGERGISGRRPSAGGKQTRRNLIGLPPDRRPLPLAGGPLGVVLYRKK